MTTERDAWLGLSNEEPLEPELSICDPHHHLWDHPNNRYLLDALRRDTGSGHRVVSTVFVECESVYRQDGSAGNRKNKTHFNLNRSESQDRQTPLEHPPSAAGGAVEPEPGEPVNQVSVGILSRDGYRLEAKLDTS